MSCFYKIEQTFRRQPGGGAPFVAAGRSIGGGSPISIGVTKKVADTKKVVRAMKWQRNLFMVPRKF